MQVRLLLVISVLLVAIVTMFLFLLATDTALSVWHRLSLAPLWVQVFYLLLLVFISSTTLYLSWRWLKPAKKETKEQKKPLDSFSLQEEILESAQSGVDVSSVVDEIREQQRRKQNGEVFIAIFGEISTGKSSLVKALLPQADMKSDPQGGTTQHVTHYRWKSTSGDSVIIADLPGFNLEHNPEILQEARRAHMVVFLCDTDITRSQMEHLDGLLETGKPIIVALNKVDQFSVSEAQAIAANISERTGIGHNDIVFIQTGGREEVIRLLHDGSEEKEERNRSSDIEPLRKVLQRHLDNDAELMEQLRDTAILLLAAEKLEQAHDVHREQQAADLVQTYSRRAIIGAMAAVAPGSDLVIQGLLATRLLQSLCKVYDVSVKDVEIESFIRLAGGKVKRMTAITLAIAGNALKAFPGIGTLTGGLIHAVAYGMIFDSLGRAAAETLASRGELRPYPAAAAFEELLNENLEAGALRFAKIAMVEKAGKNES
jgi:GTP-binding protein EngB required for normal cell division